MDDDTAVNILRKPRVAVIHPEGNINNNPSLLCLVDALANVGMEVHYFGEFCVSMPYQVPLRAKAQPFIYAKIAPPYVYGEYSLVLGVDEGLPIAENFAALSACPYAFISYEIMHNVDISSMQEKLLRASIRKASQNIAFAVVQDALRGYSLCTEYGIMEAKLQYIPVAGKGCVPHQKSMILHENLNISTDKRILLYMGSISTWSKIGWAVQHINSLPDDWVLVVHSRFGNMDEFSNAIPTENIYFSNMPFLPEEVHVLAQSADACLALYEPVKGAWSSGKNIELLGLASGKIATALQCGVPVVTNEIGLAADLIREYNAGIVIDITSESPFANLARLVSDENITARCHALFKQHLDFALWEETFVTQCRKLLVQPTLSPMPSKLVWEMNFFAMPCRTIAILVLKASIIFIVKVCLKIRNRILKHVA